MHRHTRTHTQTPSCTCILDCSVFLQVDVRFLKVSLEVFMVAPEVKPSGYSPRYRTEKRLGGEHNPESGGHASDPHAVTKQMTGVLAWVFSYCKRGNWGPTQNVS